MPKNLLLEIGCEELPYSYVEIGRQELVDKARAAFEETRILDEVSVVTAFATPRRLVLYVIGLKEKQPDISSLKVGPRWDIAFENGAPTDKGLGFARKFGVRAEALKKVEKNGKEHAGIEIEEKGRGADELLKELLPSIIKSLSFPKMMRWDETGFLFPRPIRWLLAFYGNKKLAFELSNIKSDNISYSSRMFLNKPFKVNSAKDYFPKIKSNGVILDSEERRKLIEAGVDKAASDNNAEVASIRELFIEAVGLAELPYLFEGEFKPEYTSLPKDILIASMSKHQRVFGLVGSDNRIIPKFVGVCNGEPADLRAVKTGYEEVLDAKLKDSLFFFEEDRKESFEKKVEQLKGVIFHKKLGTVQERVERLCRISDVICEQSNLGGDIRKIVKRAAFLSKADLVTHIVKEFPSLQGIMGGEYARLSGEDEKVSHAIYEHYLPKFNNDILPSSMEGAILSAADRIDLIAGYFMVGLRPTGSADPYGLRRAALGFVQVILGSGLEVSFEKLCRIALEEYIKKGMKGSVEDTYLAIRNFIRERLLFIFGKSLLVEAVLLSGYDNFVDVKMRLEAMQAIQNNKNFHKAAKVAERTKNIIESQQWSSCEVDEALLAEEEEKRLWSVYEEVSNGISKKIVRRDYSGAVIEYGEAFFEPVRGFFDNVMVNAEDEKLRKNRLSICAAINRLFSEKAADLSLVAEKG